jgi:hypothetical protein
MHGNEDVRLRVTRANHAIAEHDEEVIVTDQVRPHARLGIDARCERAGDGQHNVLFHGAIAADGTRILPAVAGIDGDDDIAIAVDRRVLRAHGFRRGDFRSDCRSGRRRSGGRHLRAR